MELLMKSLPMFVKRLALILPLVLILGITSWTAVKASISTQAHCVAHLTPIQPGSGKVSQVTLVGCYDTFAEAVYAGTKGTVSLSSHIRPDQVTEELLLSLGMGSNFTPVVTGIDYANQNWWDFGGTFQWTANQGCSATVGYIANAMPTGWNDTVRSARSYSGCNVNNHYADINRGGTSIPCDMGSTCYTMGGMAAQTSSEDWFH
jgi:hypothetical protein